MIRAPLSLALDEGTIIVENDPKRLGSNMPSRQCPGNELADRNVFLLVTAMAATLNIRKAKDANGDEVTPLLRFTPGIVRFVLRSCAFRVASG